MARKPDTISYKEFNNLTVHTSTQQDPLPSEVLFDDENTNQLEETLMGMEYDVEDMAELANEADDDDETSLELSEDDPEDDNADRVVELDESAHYKGNHV